MVKQEIASTDQTTSANGLNRSGFTGRRHIEAGRNISKGLLKRKARKRKENMDVSDEWKGLLLLRGASPQTIDELSDLFGDGDEKNKESIDFARELLRKGLISEDLTSWRFLVLHYRNDKRNLHISFFDMLRLEVFYRGIREARGGDLTLLNLYRDTGCKIDSAFDTNLADEEGYVAGLIDGNSTGKKEDRSGYYREDEDGGRWRELASGDGGSGIIFDSPIESTKRKIMRDFVPQGVR